MQHLDLSDPQFSALRALMGAEPVPGRPLPGADVLDRLNVLIPCDYLGVVYTDNAGLMTACVEIAPTGGGRRSVSIDLDMHLRHCGPFFIGVMPWRLHREQTDFYDVHVGRGDGIAIGFRNGTDHVVQYVLWRDNRLFTPREIAILDLLGPVFQRLARERLMPLLPVTLTRTERRMLYAVAAGMSNAEIAEGNCIAVGTVRKHLENSYRKLGVNNRLAAIARLRGSDQPGLDLRERVDRYA